MLGQPVSMLIPQVVGFKLTGRLPEGATATDLVLTVTQMLRRKGVVGKFVEFYGAGLAALSLADRATIANMAPEYGATCGIFPVDAETLRYLRIHRPAAEPSSAWSKRTARNRGCSTPPPRRKPSTRIRSYWICKPWSRAWPGRPGRRIAFALSQGEEGVRRSADDDVEQDEGQDGDRDLPRRQRGPGPARAGETQRAAPRFRGHRRHHQLHEYVESLGHDGGRTAGQEGGGTRPANQALGENQFGARLQGRHRLSDRRRD